MNLKGCFSKNTDDWRTPSDIYFRYKRLGFRDCFPFHADYDEFQCEYFGEKLFVNPPYSKLKDLPSWIRTQYFNDCEIHLLIPSRTDTKYFHELLGLRPDIVFIKGRLKFNESKSSAPFPSMILVFKKGVSHGIYYSIS